MQKGHPLPPKPKLTKEEIARAALELVREKGEESLTSRDVAAVLGSSARPIFTAFESMAALKESVIQMAEQIYNDFQETVVAENKYPTYKSMGMAYIRFAREEKNLFRLLYMRDRTGEPIPPNFDETILEQVKVNTGFEGYLATLFQTEMWVFIHGIASMHATTYMNFSEEFISSMITDAYQGLKRRQKENALKNSHADKGDKK